MDFDRLTCSERWQCALVGGLPGWVTAVFVVLVGESHALEFALVSVPPVTVASGLLGGYLRDGGTRESAVVGGFAGGVVVVPAVLIPLMFFVSIFRWEGESAMWALLLFVISGILFVVATIVAAALGALGGVIWARHSDGGRSSGGTKGTRDPESGVVGQREAPDHEVADQCSKQGPVRQPTDARKSGDADRAGGRGDADRAGGREDEESGRAGKSIPGRSKSWWFFGTVGGLLGMALLPVSLVWTPTRIILGLALLLAGGTAGYLQGSDRRDGAVAGAFAGVVASIPVVLVFLLEGLSRGFRAELDLILVVGLPLVVGFVAVGTLGGALGAVVSSRARGPTG